MSGQPAPSGAVHKSVFERAVETIATGLGGGIGWLAEHGVLFALFGVLWASLIVGLLVNAGAIDDLWASIGGLPLFVQLVLWLLFLPLMAGLWVWQADWPLVVRAVIVLGLAGFTLLAFRPKSFHLPGHRPTDLTTRA